MRPVHGRARPPVVDFGCGIGGVGKALHDAGFDVTGVDTALKPDRRNPGKWVDDRAILERYPYRLVRADMLTYPLERFAGAWTSAPCQHWSKMCRCRPELRALYPDLVTPMLARMAEWGGPYLMENVEGCTPLEERAHVMLCGAMFGRLLYRHRLFHGGGGVVLTQPPHPEHAVRASRAGHWEPGTVMSLAGHIDHIPEAHELMGIGWKVPRESLVEAIPVWMARYPADQLMAAITAEQAA